MWKEILVNDIEGLTKFANIRNTFGCSGTWDYNIVKKILTIKKNCHMFMYESDKYDMVLGFKEDAKSGLIVFTTISVGRVKLEDYEESLKILGRKIRDYLIKKNNRLSMPSSQGVEELHPNVLRVGFDTMIVMMTKYWKEIGLKLDWEKHGYIEVEVI